MPTDSPISTFAEETLCDYFINSVKKPRWRPWFSKVEKTADSVGEQLIAANIGPFKNAFRDWTSEGRYNFARWLWLEPQNPCWELDDISRLKIKAGLDHIEDTVFLKELQRQCRDYIRIHPQLRLWIEKRNALLEFKTELIPDIRDELNRNALKLRRAQFEAAGFLNSGQNDLALEAANSISENALLYALEGVVNILGKNRGVECPANANLMVPWNMNGAASPEFFPNETARKNNEKALRLWRHLPNPNKCLISIAETKDANYLGFWVPLDSGGIQNNLPGAPTSFFQKKPTAVFKDDLPPLSGFPQLLKEEWGTYMRNDFQQQMFVSIPFLVPQTHAGMGSVVAAVLNVNVSPPEDDRWRRAYHREWLDEVRRNIEQFLEAAFMSNGIRFSAENHMLSIDTGSSLWDTLPVYTQALLPGPSDEELKK